MEKNHPDVNIYVAAVDERLNDHAYIVPGSETRATVCSVQNNGPPRNSWDERLAGEFRKEYYLRLREFLKSEYSTTRVYPHMNDIFNALRYTDYDDVRAVILGQDPYHGPGQAHGLCFSVPDGVPKPPSLVNIFKELNDDTGIAIPQSGNLVRWAKNGVLLLNSVLTVRAGQAAATQTGAGRSLPTASFPCSASGKSR